MPYRKRVQIRDDFEEVARRLRAGGEPIRVPFPAKNIAIRERFMFNEWRKLSEEIPAYDHLRLRSIATTMEHQVNENGNEEWVLVFYTYDYASKNSEIMKALERLGPRKEQAQAQAQEDFSMPLAKKWDPEENERLVREALKDFLPERREEQAERVEPEPASAFEAVSVQASVEPSTELDEFGFPPK